MHLEKGDMFVQSIAPCVTLVTTNGSIRKDGALVMGRGAAKRLADLEPWVPYAAGALVSGEPIYGYGVMLLPCNYGIFQVKYHWKEKANTDLIVESTCCLRDLASTTPNLIYNLNFPGIGNGGLTRDEVLPYLEILPDNVVVWELGE